jgi:hypothetical protein
MPRSLLRGNSLRGPNSIAFAFSVTWATVLKPGMGIVLRLLNESTKVIRNTR